MSLSKGIFFIYVDVAYWTNGASHHNSLRRLIVANHESWVVSGRLRLSARVPEPAHFPLLAALQARSTDNDQDGDNSNININNAQLFQDLYRFVYRDLFANIALDIPFQENSLSKAC